MAIIKIYHTDPIATGGPLVAEIPEDGLENWLRSGWRADKPPSFSDPGQPDVIINAPPQEILENANQEYDAQKASPDLASEPKVVLPTAEDLGDIGGTNIPSAGQNSSDNDALDPEIATRSNTHEPEPIYPGPEDHGDSNKPESPVFSDMTVKELRQFAKDNGIPLKAGVTTKAEIIEALVQADI